MTTILEGLRSYLSECPALREVRTDMAGDRDGSCALVPRGEKTIRESITGAVVRAEEFRLHLRLAADGEQGRRENHARLEEILDWLERQQMQGRLPKLPEGYTVRDLQGTRGTMKRAEDSGLVIYELPLQLIYEKEGI